MQVWLAQGLPRIRHAIIITTTIIISIIIIMLFYDLYFLCISLIILLLGSLLKCVLARGTSERVSSGIVRRLRRISLQVQTAVCMVWDIIMCMVYCVHCIYIYIYIHTYIHTHLYTYTRLTSNMFDRNSRSFEASALWAFSSPCLVLVVRFRQL